MGEGCITIRTPVTSFVSAHFTEAPPSYPSLWVAELLRIVAPDRLGHLPSPSGGLRFLTLPRVPQRSRQSFVLLLDGLLRYFQ